MARFKKRRKFYDGWDVRAIDDRDFGSKFVGDIEPVDSHKKPQFNQYDYVKTRHACTIVNAVKDICYNYYLHFDKQLVFDAVDYCIEHWWYVVGKWWQTPRAMQYVRKFFNDMWEEATYIRLRGTDPLLTEYKYKWYMVWCSFWGNTDYVIDYGTDGTVDWTSFHPRQRWHRTSMYGDNRIWDSEYGFEYNDYKLKDLKWLQEEWTYNMWYYVWVLPENLVHPVDEIKRLVEMELSIEENIGNNQYLWSETNDPIYKNELRRIDDIHREKLNDIDIELDKLK